MLVTNDDILESRNVNPKPRCHLILVPNFLDIDRNNLICPVTIWYVSTQHVGHLLSSFREPGSHKEAT